MKKALGLIVGLALVVSACGGSDEGATTTAATAAPATTEDPTTTTEAPTTQAPAADGLAVATTDLGDVLVGEEGRTLYLFTPDTDGDSTCYDQCEVNWPVFRQDNLGTPGHGIDTALLGTTDRTDGTVQVTYNGYPLYYFAGDGIAGETNGQGLNDVWFVVAPDGSGIGMPDMTASAGLSVATSDLGDILVDGAGRTLYLFTNDSPGTSACYDGCEANWPVFYQDDLGTPGDGIDATLLGTTDRTDGTVQVTYNGWPLYYFAADAAAGDTNGQEVGGVWFVVAPDGSAIGG